MHRHLLALAVAFLPAVAAAQVPPVNWSQDYIPTLQDWQAAFAAKLDKTAGPAELGFLTTNTTWTVCAANCTYTDPMQAWNAAMNQARFSQQTITIQIADGTYAETNQFYTECNCGEYVQMIGDTANPAAVIFKFTNIVGNNFSGFVANKGGRIGLIDGITVQGAGARLTNTSWAAQSFGSGVLASGAGSNIALGAHVIVDSFYYGASAVQGGHILGSGSTYRASGEANIMAAYGGSIECQSCTLSTASNLFTDTNGVAESLGSNALANAGSILMNGSTATGAQDYCVNAMSGGLLTARNVVGSGCQSFGAHAGQNGFIDLTNAQMTHNSGGVLAEAGGGVDADFVQIDHNTYDGMSVNGGHAYGSHLNIHDNGGYGIRVQKQGKGEFYATLAALLTNTSGQYTVEQAYGCTAVNALCNPASTLILN